MIIQAFGIKITDGGITCPTALTQAITIICDLLSDVQLLTFLLSELRGAGDLMEYPFRQHYTIDLGCLVNQSVL